MTEPHAAPIFDTGPHPYPMTERGAATKPQPVVKHNPWFDPLLATEHPEPMPYGESTDNTDVMAAAAALKHIRQQPAPAQPVAVLSQYQYLKVWKLLTVLAAVWVAGGAIGLGLYYWWFQSVDKTWPEVAVLFYVLAAVVAALMLSLGEQKPVRSAASIAVLTSPFASGAAAAALYGMYAFGWVAP